MGGGIWSIAIIIGPILLAAALIWAVTHNRASRRDARRTEQATREMYDEQSAEDAMRERE